MPQTLAVREVCRVHLFGQQVPRAVASMKVHADGITGHYVDRRLYLCTGCGFPMTMPLGG